MLPNIHPELLAKKRGSKGKLEAIITPPPAKKAKSPSQKKPVSKKAGGKKGARKSKVCDLAGVCGEEQGKCRQWGSGAPFLLKVYPTDGVRHYGGTCGSWLWRAQFCSSEQSLDTIGGLGS